MNDEFEKAKINYTNAKELENVKKNPITKSLFGLLKKVPILGDLFDEGLNLAVTKFQEKKRNEFINIILHKNTFITSDKVNDVEFLINFAKTLEVVDRLATNDKVKYFAKLIKNSYLEDTKIDADEFDVYLESLKKLSYKNIEELANAIKEQKEFEKKKQSEKAINKNQYYDKRVEFYFVGCEELSAVGFMEPWTNVKSSVTQQEMRNEYDEDHYVLTDSETLYYLTSKAMEFGELVEL